MAAGDQVPLSVCIIAQDAESQLEACVRSVPFAREVVVLDGGSCDRTMDLARSLGARVEQRPFDGFVSQKNAALSHARCDWVLSLDADERISEPLQHEITALFQGGAPAAAGYDMPRRAYHLGRWIRGGGWYPDHKLRLFRRDRGRFGGEDPHDRVLVDGPVGRLHGDILHYPYQDLFDHITRMDRYTSRAAHASLAQGRRLPLLRMLAQPPLRFLKAYLLRGGFRDGRAGFVLACMASMYELMRYAKLWELQRQARER